MAAVSASAPDNPTAGIVFILIGSVAISLNDMLIKALSDGYPLHQAVFTRSAIGIFFSLFMVQMEGGWRILRTDRPGLHALRCLAVIIANMTFFAALAVLPLASATALFFVAPLLITLLSIPLLGEKVGPRRLTAVAIGFVGVLVMLDLGGDRAADAPALWVLLLPVLAAFGYALMQILTRKLGANAKPSAMAVYIQGGFILVSLLFWAVAGDGRYAEGVEEESLIVLLRAWRWPEPEDQLLFLALGANSAVIGYTLSAAYRAADAAVIAPFEYVVLPLAILWGWTFWGELPGPRIALGIALIMGAGIYVFARERARGRVVAAKRPVRRY